MVNDVQGKYKFYFENLPLIFRSIYEQFYIMNLIGDEN